MARKDTDMTRGVIWRHLVSFSLPMMLGLLFQQLYNTVDTYVVGQFVGYQALAAVGSTGPILNTMVGLSAGLATGASVIISQHYGAHDQQRLSRAVHTTIAVTLILSVLSTLAGRLLTEPLLDLMQTPEDVRPEATTYLSIYFSGITGLLMYNMGSGILRAVGDSRRPLYFLIFSAVMNTVLDLLFVIRFQMGVAGVAWATILSQLASALLILYVLTREKSAYGVRWSQVRIDGESLRGILTVGLPSGIQQAVTSFSNVFVQSYINAFGSAAMAGYSAYAKLDAFLLVPVQAIAMASTTFVGQNWGARQRPRVRAGVRTALWLSLGATLGLSAAVVIFAEPLISIFTQEPEVIVFGARFIRLITPFYFTICFNQIFGGALRGVGDATRPTVVMFCSFVVFRQIYLLVTKQLGVGFIAVALAYPVGWIVCSASLALMYYRSRICRAVSGEPDEEAPAAEEDAPLEFAAANAALEAAPEPIPLKDMEKESLQKDVFNKA